MKHISKYKIDKWILLILLLFTLISIATIYSATKILPSYQAALPIKQALWYLAGFILAYFMMFLGKDFLYKNAYILYGIGVFTLLLLLFFGKPINEAKCWFQIPGIGTVQPSEFMKIILIITYGRMIEDFHKSHKNPSIKDEFLFLIKIGITFLVPSILTFLEPDTGVVLIYLLITIVMLFVSGIRYRWFILLFSILGSAIFFLLIIYFFNNDLFI